MVALTRVLVVNAGSSSLKLRLLGTDDAVLLAHDIAAHHGVFDASELRTAVDRVADEVDAVGHRVVHGGARFGGAVLVDTSTEYAIRELADLAPLHQPESLAGIAAVRSALPDTPTVACFDTAFFATLPAAAATYPVPSEWRERLGVRRFGFHGLSHSYAGRRAAHLLGCPAAQLRVVTCHLGAGASLAAVRDGMPVDTTMGFTPLEGLMMATRSGTVDPGLVTWLVRHAGVDVDEVADALEHRSGLMALAGTSDMSEALAAADRDEAPAVLAIEVYLHRLRAGVASMASAMNGLDAVVFTGGVGESSAAIRSGAAAGLGFLGVELDERANAAPALDADVTAAGAKVRVLVVAAREDLQIASEVRSLLA